MTNYGFAAQLQFHVHSPGGTQRARATFSNLKPRAAATPPVIDGHVDPRQIMDVGVMNGNIPAPLVAFDEDDELFLTLTNVGMIMRPDLFEQHTIHFHGYPNASSVYDGVPDASVAINIGGSFTYYYLAPDAGTYFWHCHITPPEHLQMGMVGQLYVRPRQNRVPAGESLYAALAAAGKISGRTDLRTACNPAADILCSAVTPPTDNGATQGIDKLGNPQKYTYNDGDGSTAYDVEYPLQIHGFDPNFHFVGMTFNPEAFADMKSKFFLLNGRSYPDTVTPGPMGTQSSDGRVHYSQPLPSIINIPVGGKALLRISDLAVDEYATLASLGVPDEGSGLQRQAAARPDGEQYGVLHQLHHAGRRRVAGCDSGRQRRRLRIHGLRGDAVSGRQHLLSLHPATRPSFQRSGELRWTHDRSSHLQQRERRHVRQHLQLGERQ